LFFLRRNFATWRPKKEEETGRVSGITTCVNEWLLPPPPNSPYFEKKKFFISPYFEKKKFLYRHILRKRKFYIAIF
jgi:hypothetical protein